MRRARINFANRIAGAACALLLLAVALPASAADYAVPEKEKALDGVKKMVTDAAKSGKKTFVMVNLGGYVKAELTSADDKGLTVMSDSNPFTLKWEKIPQEQVLIIIKDLCKSDLKNALVGMDFCMAVGMLDKAEEFMGMAAANSKDLGDELKVRIKALGGLQDAVKAAANPQRAAAIAKADKDEPQPYKGPDMLAFHASEFGYLTPVKDVAAKIDNTIEIALADMGLHPEPVCDDLAFLRRISLDMTGEIPSPEEIIKFTGDGSNKRAKIIEEMAKRPEFADHWASFWSVLLVGRRTKEEADVKPHLFRHWLREALAKGEKWDTIVTEILTATGENDKEGAVNYLTFHMNDTLPISVGHISQTFLGARIACAQCHDHPFDKWTQQDFWGFASFLANTSSQRKELRDDPKDPMKITRQWHVLVDQDTRNGGQKYEPPQPELVLPPKVLDGPVFTVSNTGAKASKRKTDLSAKTDKGMADKGMSGMGDKGMADKGMADKGMADKSKSMSDKPAAKEVVAVSKDKKATDKAMDKAKADAKASEMSAMMGMDDNDMMSAAAGGSGNTGLLYRKAFAAWITSPKNEKFSQSAVNRIWRNMFGIGLVEPVDDIRPKNPAIYPDVMKILSDDFIASGHDLTRLITIIGNTRAYQRSSLGMLQKSDRVKQVRYFARAEVRPMTPEELFLAVVKSTAGEAEAKKLNDARRAQDASYEYGAKNMAMGMEGGELGNFNQLMQRFIGTSTAEDRAGKLQFEGTVGQALMMMHSAFMQNYIKMGTKRFRGDMTWLFATTLGRSPTQEESAAFGSLGGDAEGMLWVLMNSAEFVTIH